MSREGLAPVPENLRNGVYWVGQDGKVYVKGGSGTNDAGAYDGNSDAYWNNQGFYRIQDPSQPLGGGETLAATDEKNTLPDYSGYSGGSGNTKSAAEIAREEAEAKEAKERKTLLGDINSLSPEIDDIYGDLFKDLDTLVKDRGLTLEEQYGEQLEKAGLQYTSAIPEIETSYAAIGADQSTDNTYAKNKAKEGFEETTETIGQNKEDDLTSLGQYAKEQKTKFEVDQDSVKKNAERAKKTEDVDTLRSFRNGIEEGIDSARVAQSTLGTDEGAKGEVSRITADGGRFEEVSTALDSIIKSSVSGSVKEAAVKAVTDNAGLSDEDRDKVNKLYGNVYAEQASL